MMVLIQHKRYKNKYGVVDTEKPRKRDLNGEKIIVADFIGSREACLEYMEKVSNYANK